MKKNENEKSEKKESTKNNNNNLNITICKKDIELDNLDLKVNECLDESDNINISVSNAEMSENNSVDLVIPSEPILS